MVNQINKQTFQRRRAALLPLARFPNLANSECPINSKVYHKRSEGEIQFSTHLTMKEGDGMLI
ncbi:MAG: hypothetical protein OXN25_16310 [Candidatus Poribacteria bacterium]|nr:hypothetical protein [Candidatus Poribacteria bacterium]